MAIKQAILKDRLTEYLAANRRQKGEILAHLEASTHLHRKAIIRRLRRLQLGQPTTRERRGRKEVYGPAVTTALKEVWQLAHEICAERLHPVVGEYVRVLTRDRMWSHDLATTTALLAMSLGTMKNRLATCDRVHGRRGRGTTNPSALKEIIPIRRGPWQNPPPGYGEVDTVAHCGASIQGDFAYTVQYTDVALIWTCLAAQWNKGEVATVHSLERVARRLPWAVCGLDPDSGSEFINWHCKGWCDEQHITMTRTRPYMKNDHARIEQKNYVNVRQFLGYKRLEDPDRILAMNELYNDLEDYINFFLPSVKCLSKERTGSRYRRVYDRAQTAYQRALLHPQIPADIKATLQAKYATLNPRRLQEKINRRLQTILMNTHY